MSKGLVKGQFSQLPSDVWTGIDGGKEIGNANNFPEDGSLGAEMEEVRKMNQNRNDITSLAASELVRVAKELMGAEGVSSSDLREIAFQLRESVDFDAVISHLKTVMKRERLEKLPSQIAILIDNRLWGHSSERTLDGLLESIVSEAGDDFGSEDFAREEDVIKAWRQLVGDGSNEGVKGRKYLTEVGTNAVKQGAEEILYGKEKEVQDKLKRLKQK